MKFWITVSVAVLVGVILGIAITYIVKEVIRESRKKDPREPGTPRIEVNMEISLSSGEARLVVENTGTGAADELHLCFPNLFSIANSPYTGEHSRNIADGVISRALVFRRQNFRARDREEVIVGYVKQSDEAMKQVMNLGLEYEVKTVVDDKPSVSNGIVRSTRYHR